MHDKDVQNKNKIKLPKLQLKLKLKLHYVPIPTKWRSYRGHRFCDVTSPNVLTLCFIFTARCYIYASAVLAMALCLSVCPSVTSRCSTKTTKHRITQTTPHDSPGTLVFSRQRSPRNSTGVTPYEGAECRWGWSKIGDFRQVTGYISKTVKYRHIL